MTIQTMPEEAPGSPLHHIKQTLTWRGVDRPSPLDIAAAPPCTHVATDGPCTKPRQGSRGSTGPGSRFLGDRQRGGQGDGRLAACQSWRLPERGTASSAPCLAQPTGLSKSLPCGRARGRLAGRRDEAGDRDRIQVEARLSGWSLGELGWAGGVARLPRPGQAALPQQSVDPGDLLPGPSSLPATEGECAEEGS